MRPLLLLVFSTAVAAQQPLAAKPARTSPWLPSQTINFVALTPGPPQAGGVADQRDMEAVLQAQQRRTAAQVQQSKADDQEEDIFIFSSVLGADFRADQLPLTSTLSQHLRDASAVINPELKLRFGRPRPFVASTKVHPVCVMAATGSYPSGHGMVGTLEALALTQIVPERSQEILNRLDDYLQNRVVCGVHYPSDVAASRLIATALFGEISSSPSFQSELATARTEVRTHLGLTDTNAGTASTGNYLADNTVLIVRHAEKPPEEAKQAGLTEQGQRRADAYAQYFQPFQDGGMKLRVSALYAGADSTSSVRPRLTLEPLSKASGIPLDTSVSTKDPQALVSLLTTHPHGKTPLISWRHGQIPALLTSLGASPETLLPGGKWPDEVFDWVLVLQFDAQGHFKSQRLLHESLKVK